MVEPAYASSGKSKGKLLSDVISRGREIKSIRSSHNEYRNDIYNSLPAISYEEK